ncbi:ribonuclease inhibitor-like [Oryzias melastigma]|uniref:ribonuclease inhibitor-like n=1 Tax=Oryzias melastigma TaxID=30732 RepID=UPI000CF7BEA1|nr:ribonuclease inhibitor-like [Oryzias melastigma]
MSCSLTKTSCEALGTALKNNPSKLTELDLSGNNNLQDSGFIHLGDFLKSPGCRLQTLRLENCGLSEKCCEVLGSALKINPTNLTELDLSHNKNIQDVGVLYLHSFFKNLGWRLQTLRLNDCSLSSMSCTTLVSALKSNPSYLAELDLKSNDLQDSDVRELQDLVKNPKFNLQTLRWKD